MPSIVISKKDFKKLKQDKHWKKVQTPPLINRIDRLSFKKKLGTLAKHFVK